MELPPSSHDPDDVRDLADRILAEARFDRPPESLPERIQGWFADRIGDLLGQLVGTGAGTIVAWVVVLGAVAAVVYLVVRHGRSVSVDRPFGDPGAAMVELSRPPGAWRAEAVELERAGRWKDALRCRYRALVGDLVRRGAIAEQAGRTAGEHLRDVAAARPDAAPAMAEATSLFEAAWYGNVPTGEAESARFQALEAEILTGPSRQRVSA